MTGVVIANPRDAREFIEAKRRKREPIRFIVDGAAEASFVPKSAADFSDFRSRLIGAPDWGRASERIEALEFELKMRTSHSLPCPSRVIQNEDSSVSIFWEARKAKVMVRCFVDKFFSMIGGMDGPKSVAVTTELLDALAVIHRIQGSM